MAARVVLDEFTAPAEKAALLERSRGRIEALFGVGLAVLGALGTEEPLPARIWLQLRGAQEAVHSAKVSPAWLARAAGLSGIVPGASVSLFVKGAARASPLLVPREVRRTRSDQASEHARCAGSRSVRQTLGWAQGSMLLVDYHPPGRHYRASKSFGNLRPEPLGDQEGKA